MIDRSEYIRAWNRAGIEFNADLLGLIFKKLESPDDVTMHNFMMAQLNNRLCKQETVFVKKVAELVEQLSLRNLDHGKDVKKGTS